MDLLRVTHDSFRWFERMEFSEWIAGREGDKGFLSMGFLSRGFEEWDLVNDFCL